MSNIEFPRRKRAKVVDLNVTSLVDVLFLLLIFFTLTSTFKRAGELDLQLPESTTAGPASAASPDQQPLTLVLTGQGTLLVDGAPATFETLLPRLRAVREQEPAKQVVIEAERDVDHGEVVRLLDAVRTAGFTGVGIGVRASEGDDGRPR